MKFLQTLSLVSFLSGLVTLPAAAAPTADTNAPAVPAHLTVLSTTAAKVVLGWDPVLDVSDPVTYNLQRDDALIASALSQTNYTDIHVRPGTNYSYRVQAVDAAGNASAFSPPVTATTGAANLVDTPGLLFEVWSGIPGTNIFDLLSDPRFQSGESDVRALATAADTRTVYPDNSHDDYGARLSGFLVPRESGVYELFLRSGGASELWLSSDESPTGLVLLARETGCCQEFQEPGAEQTSGPITFLAGKRYAIEVLSKAGTAPDYAQVAWRRTSDLTPAANLPPIQGRFLLTQWDATVGQPVITTAPESASVTLGGSATLTVAATIGDRPMNYQWAFISTNILAATNTTLTVTNFGIAQLGTYRVLVQNAFGSASAEAVLLPKGALFVEAEDFNFGQGQYVTNRSIGMSGPYTGDAYRGLGTQADTNIDWSANPDREPAYRPGTGPDIGPATQDPISLARGDFDLQINHTVASSPGDWYNYTRLFPSTAREYYVFSSLTSGTNTAHLQMDQVVSAANSTNQILAKLGEFKPGRPIAAQFEFVPLVDNLGTAVILTNFVGEETFRISALPGGEQEIDYFMFVPLGGGTEPGKVFTSVIRVGDMLVLAWDAGILESATDVEGPWLQVNNAVSPWSVALTGPRGFYRLR